MNLLQISKTAKRFGFHIALALSVAPFLVLLAPESSRAEDWESECERSFDRRKECESVYMNFDADVDGAPTRGRIRFDLSDKEILIQIGTLEEGPLLGVDSNGFSIRLYIDDMVEEFWRDRVSFHYSNIQARRAPCELWEGEFACLFYDAQLYDRVVNIFRSGKRAQIEVMMFTNNHNIIRTWGDFTLTGFTRVYNSAR
jgi:hypothetical protein